VTQRALNLGRKRNGPKKGLRVHVVLARLVDNAQVVRGPVRRRTERAIDLPDLERSSIARRVDADDPPTRRRRATGSTA